MNSLRVEYVFEGRAGIGPRPVMVIDSRNGARHRLPHLVRHSPDGFAWGYGGSGPSDLARSLVGFLTGDDNPDPKVYQEVKWRLVAEQGEAFHLTSEQVWKVIDEALQ